MMKIFVQYFLLERKTIILDVNWDDTVHNVKQKIEIQKGVPLALQRLSFNGRVLGDDNTLFNHNVSGNSILQLVIGLGRLGDPQVVYEVTVKSLDGGTIKLAAASHETVHSLKQKIQDKEGIPVQQQILFYAGVAVKDERFLYTCREMGRRPINIPAGPVSIFLHLAVRKEKRAREEEEDTESRKTARTSLAVSNLCSRLDSEALIAEKKRAEAAERALEEEKKQVRSLTSQVLYLRSASERKCKAWERGAKHAKDMLEAATKESEKKDERMNGLQLKISGIVEALAHSGNVWNNAVDVKLTEMLDLCVKR